MYFICSIISKKYFPFGWWSIVLMLMMCSALGVIVPENVTQSIFFGACIGAVMFGAIAFYNCTMSGKKCDLKQTFKKIVILIAAGMILGIIANLIVYYSYWENKDTQTLLDPVTNTKNIVWQLSNGAIFAALVIFAIFFQRT